MEKDTESVITAREDEEIEKSKKRSAEPQPIQLQLDTGEEYVRYRKKFWQLWYVYLSRSCAYTL